MNTLLRTGLVDRLRANDQGAWYELWDTFGPALRAQLTKWGRGRVGVETVRDLSQETMSALAGSIDRFDPGRGVRFSTWLLAIAKHVLSDELDRRGALKRGGGERASSLDGVAVASDAGTPSAEYEAAVFAAKVQAALRLAEKELPFDDFAIYRMRVLDGMPGKEVAEALGVSEPTVSRRLAKVRQVLRDRLREVVATYSFTPEELQEVERRNLSLEESGGDAAFDEALAEICGTEYKD